MPPIWNSDLADVNLYEEVEHHSEGMISFAYRPPAPAQSAPEAQPAPAESPQESTSASDR